MTELDPDYILPCDVMVPPSTIILAGCKLSTLVDAIKCREKARQQYRMFATPSESPQP